VEARGYDDLHQEGSMTAVFSLSDFGRAFATRERGAELRDGLLEQYPDAAEVVIDLAGVANFSYSFADEFFGKLAGEKGVKVVVKNGTSRLDAILARAVATRHGCAVSV
jgi:hypothetical protein